MTFDELYRQAKSVLHRRRLSDGAEAGGVSAALLAESGKVYLGVCIDTVCSMGFCAEHAAAAAMVTAGESRVLKMIAVGEDGRVIPPWRAVPGVHEPTARGESRSAGHGQRPYRRTAQRAVALSRVGGETFLAGPGGRGGHRSSDSGCRRARGRRKR